MWSTTSGAQYKALNQWRIDGQLLDSAYKDTAASVPPITYGGTIASDRLVKRCAKTTYKNLYAC